MPIGIIAESFFSILSKFVKKIEEELNEKITLNDIVLVNITPIGGVVQVITKTKGLIEFTIIFNKILDRQEKERQDIKELADKIKSKEIITVKDLFWI